MFVLALASNANINHQHVAVNNQSTTSLGNATPMSLSNPNNPLSRLQENANESSSNPFNVKIPRPAFKGMLTDNGIFRMIKLISSRILAVESQR